MANLFGLDLCFSCWSEIWIWRIAQMAKRALETQPRGYQRWDGVNAEGKP
jgi:hypothetical protein